MVLPCAWRCCIYWPDKVDIIMKATKSFSDILKFILPFLVGTLIYAFLLKLLDYVPTSVLLSIILLGIILAYFSYQTSNFIIPRKGFDYADLKRIQFAKNWFKTRQQGMWRFVIMDGAIIFGALLSLCICLFIFVCYWEGNFAAHFPSPTEMFTLIGYSYLAGAFAAAICNRIIWMLNERKFNRLTNPLS